jgi:hypothetical protein
MKLTAHLHETHSLAGPVGSPGVQPRAAHAPRVGGPATDRGRALEQADRGQAMAVGRNREVARLRGPRQARCRFTGSRRRNRIQAGTAQVGAVGASVRTIYAWVKSAVAADDVLAPASLRRAARTRPPRSRAGGRPAAPMRSRPRRRGAAWTSTDTGGGSSPGQGPPAAPRFSA